MKVIVAGLPGKMSTKVVEHLLGRSDFNILPFSPTGLGQPVSCNVSNHNFILLLPEQHEDILGRVVREHGSVVVVDYTHPLAVNRNAEMYCRLGLPFVMGTTGGDREKLGQTVEESDVPAVIAPNMAKQIVGFQAMMQFAAETFPELFSGYQLDIWESHQEGKADTSGTAKAMVKVFNQLGISFDEEQIEKERDPFVQRKTGVPEENLGGHGWHTYSLLSGDGTVKFEFTHNVNGRDVYALGTIDALLFLKGKMEKGVGGKAFSMIDVLRG